MTIIISNNVITLILLMSALSSATLFTQQQSKVTPPTFPTRFSARIHEVEHAKGGTKIADCDLHWDAKANATSYRNCGKPLKPGMKGSQMQMVLRFNDHREGNSGTVYYVYGYGPAGNTCAYWCDLQGTQQCDLQESLCQYDYVAHAKYNGTATINNSIKTNVFTWSDNLGPISMNSLSLYVNQKNNAPVKMSRDVHPFGKELGTMDTYFSNWDPTPPPSSSFDIPGLNECMEGAGNQCQNSLNCFKR